MTTYRFDRDRAILRTVALTINAALLIALGVIVAHFV
jgi:hypothetical protein